MHCLGARFLRCLPQVPEINCNVGSVLSLTAKYANQPHAIYFCLRLFVFLPFWGMGPWSEIGYVVGSLNFA
jgi:hypothetical protein